MEWLILVEFILFRWQVCDSDNRGNSRTFTKEWGRAEAYIMVKFGTGLPV